MRGGYGGNTQRNGTNRTLSSKDEELVSALEEDSHRNLAKHNALKDSKESSNEDAKTGKGARLRV